MVCVTVCNIYSWYEIYYVYNITWEYSGVFVCDLNLSLIWNLILIYLRISDYFGNFPWGGGLGEPVNNYQYYYYKSGKVFHTTNGAELPPPYLGNRVKNNLF